MNLLKLLGLVSLGKYRRLQQEHAETQLRLDRERQEIARLRETLGHMEAQVGVAATGRVEVAEMLRKAMDDVTSAVGLAHVLDAAIRKLDTGDERREPEKAPEDHALS